MAPRLLYGAASRSPKEMAVKTKNMFRKAAYLALLGVGLPLVAAAQGTRDRIEPKLVPVPNDDYRNDRYRTGGG